MSGNEKDDRDGPHRPANRAAFTVEGLGSSNVQYRHDQQAREQGKNEALDAAVQKLDADAARRNPYQTLNNEHAAARNEQAADKGNTVEAKDADQAQLSAAEKFRRGVEAQREELDFGRDDQQRDRDAGNER